MSEVLKGLKNINDREDRVRYARENKGEILQHKKMMPKNDSLIVKVDESMFIDPVFDVSSLGLKDDEVLTVSNAINFLDNHDDVSLRGSWNKTVADKGNRIPQLFDHEYLVKNLYAKNLESIVMELPIKALGYNAEGTTEVLAYKIKPYNNEDLTKYQDGTYRQHSSGLRYKKIWLGIDDPSDEDSHKLYLSQIDNIINRAAVEENGFYFGVESQEAIENSLVVFASNRLTPAFTNINLDSEPSKNIRTEPPNSTQKKSYYGIFENIKY